MSDDLSVSNTPESVSDVPEIKLETIAYETHKKLLNQRKSDQEKMRAMEQQLNEFTNASKLSSEQKLIEDGKLNEMIEIQRAELEAAKRENLEYKDSIDKAIKISAFRDQLGGTIDNSSYYDFVNVDEIVLDRDSGVVDSASVEQVVNQFKQTHSKLYTPKASKALPNDAPRTNVPINTIPNNKIDIANALREQLAQKLN